MKRSVHRAVVNHTFAKDVFTINGSEASGQ